MGMIFVTAIHKLFLMLFVLLFLPHRYLADPHCDCMHTYKILDDAKEEIYHEAFEFKCAKLGRTSSIIDERPVALTEHRGVFNQSISWSYPPAPIPGLADAVFNTATIAFKKGEGEQEQYDWVIEFTCGTLPEDFMQHLFPGVYYTILYYAMLYSRHCQ